MVRMTHEVVPTSTQQQEQHEHVELSVDTLCVVVYHVQGHRTTGLGICTTSLNIALGVWIQTMVMIQMTCRRDAKS